MSEVKTKKCKACGTEVVKLAKVCPECGIKFKMGWGKKILIGFGVLIVLGWMLPDGDPDPTAPTTAVVDQQEEVKLTDADKALLKGSYADFDSAQRTQFTGIEKAYTKLADADKEVVKADFERLTAEKDVVVAKALAEAKKKAAEEEAARKAEEKAAAEAKIASFKAECKTVNYKDLARNPEEHKGTPVKYTGEVIQVQEDGNIVGLRVDVTKNSYGYEDTVFVLYDKSIVNGRILEDDIITFYGTSNGLLTYKTVLGADMTIPQVLASIVEISQ